MNNLPEELQLHILTYIKVLSVEIKPLLEINKSIRKLLWEKKYNLGRYPCTSNESIASAAYSFLEYMRFLRQQQIDMDDQILNEIIEENEIEMTDINLDFLPF